MKTEEYLDYYYKSISFQGELQINAIKIIAEEKGQGAEYISCSYDVEDEDYRKGYVTLYFWKPAVYEDVIIYVDNLTFYNGLAKICDEDTEKHPEHKTFLDGYLEKIKKSLCV